MFHYSLRRLKKIAAGAREPRGFHEHLETCEKCHNLLELASASVALEISSEPPPPPDDHLSLEQFLMLRSGQLSDRHRERVIAHLSRCQSCQSEMVGFGRAAATIEANTAIQPVANRTRKARELWQKASVQPQHGARPGRISSKNPMTICIVADDSKSMAGEPGEEMTQSIRDFAVMLQASCGGRHSYFRLLLIKFGDFPKVIYDLVPILDVDPNRVEITGASGGSDVGAVLELACQKLSDPKLGVPVVPPLVLLYSDGSNSGSDPLPWADRIKALKSQGGEPPFLVTCGFGEVDKPLLEKIATSPAHFKNLTNPFELRRFLAQIGSTVSSLATEGRSPATVRQQILSLIGKAA